MPSDNVVPTVKPAWMLPIEPRQERADYYFRTVLDGQREWYDKNAGKQKRRYLAFAICVIVLGALISLAAEKEEQERRVRDAKKIAQRTTIGFVVALVVASLAVWQYFEAKREAQRANAGRLAIAADKEKDHSIDLALLLASEAVGAASEPTSEAQSALLSALLTHPQLQKILHGHHDEVTSISFSPDGKRLASGSLDKTVRLWDAETGQPIGALKGHNDYVWIVAFSPDGKRLASASLDKIVRLWDAESGQPLGAPLTGYDGIVMSVAFSPDGKRLASASQDRTVRLWDAESGQPRGAPLNLAMTPP